MRNNDILKIIPVGPNSEGKLPPQAIDLEMSVLGALLLDKEAMNEVSVILTQDSFYKDCHVHIFKAMLSLNRKCEPIDLLTVTQELRENGNLELVGGVFYVMGLTNRINSSANVEFHARIVQEKYLQRQIIQLCNNTIRKAYEDTSDVFEILTELESSLFGLTNQMMSKEPVKVEKLHLEQIKNLENKDLAATGVQSGFNCLDSQIGSFKKGHLIIIAARPAMGKSAFVNSLCKNISVYNKKPVLVFSLEMMAMEFHGRLTADIASVNGMFIANNNVNKQEFERIMDCIKVFKDVPLFVDDTPNISFFELRAKARRLKAKEDIQLVVVDYLQLMTIDLKGANREQEISTISRSLKGLAKELEIPVIALSQLSRETEKRSDKKPMLSDLRESGAIEQDADMVGFIYREEYYAPDDVNVQGQADLLIRKHRGGALSDVKFKYIKEYTRFEDTNPNTEYHTYDVDITNKEMGESERLF